MRPWAVAGRSLLICAWLVACSKHPTSAMVDSPSPEPSCTPFELAIPATSGGLGPTWLGDEYLVSPMRGALQVVTNDGMLGSTFATIPSSDGEIWDLAWNGSALGVLLYSTVASGSLSIDRFDHDGTPLGSTMIATLDGADAWPSLMWAGDRFVAVWITESNIVLHIQEIAADGSLGSLLQFGQTDVGFSFNIKGPTTSTSTTYAISMGSGTPTFALIDRATGQISHVVSNDLSITNPWPTSRDDQLAFISGTGASARFVAIDPGPTLRSEVDVPIPAGAVGMVPWTTGYHAYGLGPPASGFFPLYTLDLDASGGSSGPAAKIDMIPTGGSTGGPAGVSRGNGFALMVAYGDANTNSWTQRLRQLCDP